MCALTYVQALLVACVCVCAQFHAPDRRIGVSDGFAGVQRSGLVETKVFFLGFTTEVRMCMHVCMRIVQILEVLGRLPVGSGPHVGSGFERHSVMSLF